MVINDIIRAITVQRNGLIAVHFYHIINNYKRTHPLASAVGQTSNRKKLCPQVT